MLLGRKEKNFFYLIYLLSNTVCSFHFLKLTLTALIVTASKINITRVE